MNIALFSFFFRVSSRKTSCNNFCSLSLNNLNSKFHLHRFITGIAFLAHQSLVLDSVAVCSFIGRLEFFCGYRAVRSLGRGATVGFFHVFGDYLCPKYRATESKSFIRFLSDHPLNLEWRKKKKKLSCMDAL